MAHEKLWQNVAFRKAFQRWWDEDWSWSGLAQRRRRKSLRHKADAENLGSLQDVWDAEKKGLVKFADRQWTRFHLPPFDRDGVPCPHNLWKAAKDTVSTILNDKLRMPGHEYVEDVSDPINSLAENYADLRGIVASEDIDASPATVADLGSAIFLGGFRARKKIAADLTNIIICGTANFARTQFYGGASFPNSSFFGRARFDAATFPEDSSFENAEFFEIVSFSGTAFEFATFRNATFHKPSTFAGTVFGGDAIFIGTSFLDGVSFVGTAFSQYTGFNGSRFLQYVTFTDATFSQSIAFPDTKFFGTASFHGVTPFAKSAKFSNAEFHKDVDFSGRKFVGVTDFSATKFRAVAKFHGAELNPDTSFLSAEFRDGKSGGELPPHRLSWFRTDLEGGLHEDELRPWIKRRLRTYLRWKNAPFGLRQRTIRGVRQAHDVDAERYEIAYRQLRWSCAEIGSIEYEGFFHALELRAHRARTDTNPTARVASLLYDWLSNYGRSMGRPLYCLVVAWFAFMAIYETFVFGPFNEQISGSPPVDCGTLEGPTWWPLLATVGRQFLPAVLGSSTGVAAAPDWLRCAATDSPFLFFAVNLLQVLTFVVLTALFIIALRRRFQIRQ